MNASKSFAGKILHVDDQEVDQELLAFYLRNSAVELYRAFDRDQAIDEIEKRYFDLIVCDLNLGSGRGETAISDIRQAGFRGPIIALTSESTHSRLEAAQHAGATKIVHKPYEPAVLLSLIEECLKSVGAQGGEEPIYSELGDQPGMAQMIGTYLDRVKRITNQLVLAIEKEDLESVRHCCQTLRATGTGYGFSSLTSAANQAIVALDASSSIPESQAELERLTALVRRLRLRSDSSVGSTAAPTSQPASPNATPKPPRG
jgi:CheY-like chemotaxis protein